MQIAWFLKFKFMNRLLLIIGLFTFINISNAQSQSDNKRVLKVLDYITGKPVENVGIYNKSKNLSTLSDEEGKFDLNIFSKRDTIYFQHPSYKPYSIAVKNIKKSQHNIFLQLNIIEIPTFVISTSRSKENRKEVPYKVDVIKSKEIKLSTALTSADLLQHTGNVLVQKSQGGGGSPILRGFEANKILLVVDGVRLNNSIYRNGHLQNSITIDNSILERAEIIFGSSSVIYGSDALGGVIHYYTKDPVLALKKNTFVSANAYSQYSSINNGFTEHVDVNVGFKRFASLTSFTYKKIGDIKIGKKRDPFLNDFGKTIHYADVINGVDTMMLNDDPLVQKRTGYSQYDFLQKFLYQVNDRVNIIANIQYSTSSNVDRFDKLNDYKGDVLKFAEYYYGPQNRLLSSVKAVVDRETKLFSNITTTLAYQKIDEDRITRKFDNDNRFFQNEDVNVYSANIDFIKNLKSKHKDKINYGFEVAYNEVFSSAHYEDINTNERSIGQTRYPDGDSYTQNYSFYISYKKFLTKELILNSGFRYTYANLQSKFLDTTFANFPFESIEIKNGAPTGSLSLVYNPNKKWQLSGILSTGFRLPNVDDYGKIRAKDDFITIPNDKLTSEYVYNAEVGLTRTINGYIKINGTIFYTYLKDAIARANYQLNGVDSMMYDGDYYQIITNKNAAEAVIKGASFSIMSDINRDISFKSTLNYVHGLNVTDDVPLGHIPPLFGITSIKYNAKNFNVEAYVIYNGWKKLEEFSPYGEDNDPEATEFGYPEWFTINTRATYTINKTFQVQMAIENILDRYYKTFASGVSAPGRNFIFTVRGSF